MNPRSLLLIATGVFALVSCKSPEARRPVQQSSGSFIKESAERNKILYKKEEERIASIMAANPENEYLSSPSGFWYYYNIKDSLDVAKPVYGDIVTFTYDIKSLEGTSILTETETGLQTYKIDQSNQDLISGLRDGVKLMKVGEQVTFLFPSYKAYGYYGLEDILGTNVPIQSTVTLKSIQQSQ
jgi:gliding motility-associated peptidyl-prolyl isomerase